MQCTSEYCLTQRQAKITKIAKLQKLRLLPTVVNRQGGANARRTRLSNGHELWKGPSSTGHRSVVLPSPGHALAFAVLLPNLSYIMSHYGAHQRGPVATAHMHMLHTPRIWCLCSKHVETHSESHTLQSCPRHEVVGNKVGLQDLAKVGLQFAQSGKGSPYTP